MSGKCALEVIIEPVEAGFSEHIEKIGLLVPGEYLDALRHESESPLEDLFEVVYRPYLCLLLYNLVLLHRKLYFIVDLFGLRPEHEIAV